MPYSGPSDSSLPSSVQKLPKALRELWVRVFNENYDADDEGKAFRIAWGVVRKVRVAKKARELVAIDLDDVRPWLLDEVPMKSEKKQRYPATAYLHVPDARKPSTWKLRVADVAGNVTRERLTELVSETMPDELNFAFKTFVQPDGRTRWLIISSGNFEDRDEETMSHGFISDALDYATKHDSRGTLNIWHIPHSDIGDCDYQELIGEPGFLLESGLFHVTPAGRKAATYYQQHAPEKGVSIEYLWANRTPDGTFEAPGVIIRRSLLPRSKAAFPWSALQLKETTIMKTRPEQIAELAKVIGVSEEEAQDIVAHLESGAKELADYGVKWKEITDPGEPAPEIPATEVDAPAIEEVPPALEPVVAEAEALPQTVEVIFTPESLQAVAAQIGETVQGVLTDMQQKFSDLAAQVLQIAQQQQEYAAAVKSIELAVKELKESDDAKIAEQVKNLPRATVTLLTKEAQRPSQRQPDVETKKEESMLARAKATLYS